ncbi:MAG TPA: lytic murein transglycosylase B [Gammaproteobacteria bacterium]|nr:lytic murein transglycosylase B [Gammaproteobacteria bacterium]
MIRLPALLLVLVFSAAAWAGYADRSEVQAFIGEMSRRHGFDRADLQKLFTSLQPRREVIEAISRPAERKPWYRYRPIFLTERRIREGAAFLKRHARALERARARYGVPPEIVTAILGVETFYGRHRGRHPVLEALATLAFDYPARGRFFRGELEQFLLLAREEDMNPRTALGSYAGAMGQPQFIASSFRSYAVDFDGDGRRDIWDGTVDAIGSVANYLARHGWRAQAPVALPAEVSGMPPASMVIHRQPRRPSHTVADLQRHGVRAAAPLPPDAKAALLPLEGEKGPEYWLVLDNFHVITRYNHSPLYAMAVYQLSREIARRAP